MNLKNIQRSIDFLNLTMTCFVIIALLSPLTYFITEDKSCIFRLCILFVVTLISFLLKELCYNIPLFFLLHLLLMGGLYLIPASLFEHVIYIGYTVICIIYHTYWRLTDKVVLKKNISVLIVIALFIPYFVNYQLGYDFLTKYIMLGFFACCLLYLINVYNINYVTFYTATGQKINASRSKMIRANRIMVSILIVLDLGVMVLFSKINLTGFLITLKNGIITILRFIFSFTKNEPPMAESTKRVNTSVNMLDYYGLLDEDPKPSPIWVFLENVLKVIFVIGIVVGVICLIIFVLYLIYKSFHQETEQSVDKREFLFPTKSEKSYDVKEKKHRISFLKTNNEKIRKYFYRQIIQRKTDDNLQPYTSKELLKLVTTPTNKLLQSTDNPYSEDLELMHSLYDKARYSDLQCSKDEVTKMKQLKL